MNAAALAWGMTVLLSMSAQATPIGKGRNAVDSPTPSIVEINQRAGLLGNPNCGEMPDCEKDCRFGYETGADGCPVCSCIPDDKDILIEGDMISTPEVRDLLYGTGSRGSTALPWLWPGGVVPYVIDSSLATQPTAMAAIMAAMNDWTSQTCIRFIQRTVETAYVNFVRGQGCSSYVGRQGIEQPVTLEEGCWYNGIVAHEIGHALGYFHEQSRPDRDDYVTIYWNNIQSGVEDNFEKYSTFIIDSLGTTYDYGSVMHYASYDFSKNGQPTIVPKQSGVTIGQRDGISPMDAQQMNLLYKCGSPPTVATPAPCMDTNERRCRRHISRCNSSRKMQRHCRRTCGLC